MLKKLFFLSAFIIFSFTIHAQLIVPVSNQSNDISPRNVLAALAKAIKSDAYLKSSVKDKNAFLNNTSVISDGNQMKKNVLILAKLLKPEKVKNQNTMADLTNGQSTNVSMKEAAKLLEKLESNLKPEATSAIWKLQRKTWLTDLHELH